MVIRPDSFIRNSSDFSPSWRWCGKHTFLWKWNLQHLLFSQASLSPMLFVVVSFGRVLKPPWQHFSKKMPAVSTTLMFLILQTVWSEITSTTYFWMIYFLAELAHHLTKAELYKVKEVQKKFKWVDTQLKFKVPLSPLAPEVERWEFWTLVECQLI